MDVSIQRLEVRFPYDWTAERKTLVRGCLPYQKINQLVYLARELQELDVSKILDWLEK